MSYPIYILDDDTVLFTKEDINHVEFWQKTVAPLLAQKMKIPTRKLLNIPYSQRRGRIVGNILYCGEKISKKLLKLIEKIVRSELKIVFDEHEKTIDYDVAKFKNLV